MSKYNFELQYFTTCMPDYFLGTSLPYVSVFTWPMTLSQLRSALIDELNNEGLQCAGSYTYDELNSDEFYSATIKAVEEFEINKDPKKIVFKDMDLIEEGADSIYSYFVFIKAE